VGLTSPEASAVLKNSLLAPKSGTHYYIHKIRKVTSARLQNRETATQRQSSRMSCLYLSPHRTNPPKAYEVQRMAKRVVGLRRFYVLLILPHQMIF
jgi:hypothetical protein